MKLLSHLSFSVYYFMPKKQQLFSLFSCKKEHLIVSQHLN